MARGVPDAVIEMLHNVPLLSACNKKELRQIANLGTHVSVSDGAVLTEQGQPGREFFLLVHGAARCLVDGALVANFSSGAFFGEMALLDHGPRHATVIAEGPTELIVLNGSEFAALLDASPSITKKLLFALAERTRANATVHS
jgi:CRP/FNR family transcriptional regulator, cyclic AMP receptor protein